MSKSDEKSVINDGRCRFHEVFEMKGGCFRHVTRNEPTKKQVAKEMILTIIGSYGTGLSIDPLPCVKRTWSTEHEGLWMDWVSLSKDVSDVMDVLLNTEIGFPSE